MLYYRLSSMCSCPIGVPCFITSADDITVYDFPFRGCNDWDKAEKILALMKSRAIKPNEVTYTELIGVCGRSGDVHQALVRKTNPTYC